MLDHSTQWNSIGGVSLLNPERSLPFTKILPVEGAPMINLRQCGLTCPVNDPPMAQRNLPPCKRRNANGQRAKYNILLLPRNFFQLNHVSYDTFSYDTGVFNHISRKVSLFDWPSWLVRLARSSRIFPALRVRCSHSFCRVSRGEGDFDFSAFL